MAHRTIILTPTSATVETPKAPAPGDAGATDRSLAALAEAINTLAATVTALTATVAAKKVTTTFAADAARAAAVPAFIGQLGVQIDTNALYIGTALTAGSWSIYPAA